MKQLFVSLAVLLSVSVNAQSAKFAEAMQTNLSSFDAANTPLDLQSTAAAFERIADAEKTQWLPYYYAALAKIRVGWMDENADKDANAEAVKALVSKAEAIEPNAELCALKNMAATQQMLVDPQSRWQTYGMEAGAALQEGMKLDPNNPRLYYLQAMSLFNTPVQFGGGKEKAKPVFEKAIELFKAEQPKPMHPHWGLKEAEDMLAKCNA